MTDLKKNLFFLIFVMALPFTGLSQPAVFNQKYVDSITKLLPNYPNDTNKVNHLVKLASMYVLKDPALTIKYADEGADIADKINYPVGRINCLGQAAFVLAVSGEWAKSTYKVNIAIQLAEKYKPVAMIYMCNIMWINSKTREDNLSALDWVNKAKNNPAFKFLSEVEKWPTYMQLGEVFQSLNRLDSAKYYEKIVLDYQKKYGSYSQDLSHNSFGIAGNIALKEKRFNDAIHNFNLAEDNLGLANTYHILQKFDSAIYYAEKTLQKGFQLKIPSNIQNSAKILADEYSKINPSISNKYLTIYINSRDSLFRNEKLKSLELINLTEQKNKFESEKKDTATRNLVLVGTLLSMLVMATIAAFLLWRNNRFKQIANAKLEKAFNNLKSTQSQLIQSEKMASLGELTAGIAHEIQNPLNFVNNFSELNVELLEELQTEMRPLLAEGEVGVTALIDDIKSNSEKINHHGQRAASIVKGMLQHSRSSSATKELTDINALCDEYLRLAYHGLRAKDKSFNAEFKTEFDETIPKVNIVPQDMGRVVLNLINNAFFAVGERGKEEAISHKVEAISSEEKGIPSGLQLTPHSPTVTVSTKNLGNKIEITVSDNGTGIPNEIKEKIFQPFFTTKPTGQGTGLGLSLAYDIVTKVHGGKLTVESEQGKGTTFKIEIPT